MLLFWYVRARSLAADLWVRTLIRARMQAGQTTAEYALVILAAAAVAVVLIAWARSSGKLPAFFDNIIDQVAGSAA
jgi:Flp pilus assembly pilin Flp